MKASKKTKNKKKHTHTKNMVTRQCQKESVCKPLDCDSGLPRQAPQSKAQCFVNKHECLFVCSFAFFLCSFFLSCFFLSVVFVIVKNISFQSWDKRHTSVKCKITANVSSYLHKILFVCQSARDIQYLTQCMYKLSPFQAKIPRQLRQKGEYDEYSHNHRYL